MSSFDITNQEELNVFMNELNKVVHSVTEFESGTIPNSSKSVQPNPTPISKVTVSSPTPISKVTMPNPTPSSKVTVSSPTPSPKAPSSVKGMVVIDELNITTDADDKIKIMQKPIETINIPVS